MVVAENRPGDPTFAFFSALSGGTISDLDGARSARPPRTRRRGHGPLHARHRSRCRRPGRECRRASRPSGLTPFGHALKPDVTAPGAQILSSTLPEFAGDQFAVLDGTSFSAPHVAARRRCSRSAIRPGRRSR